VLITWVYLGTNRSILAGLIFQSTWPAASPATAVDRAARRARV
jgi:hypothetical protein